jgi:hypothetical protein
VTARLDVEVLTHIDLLGVGDGRAVHPEPRHDQRAVAGA